MTKTKEVLYKILTRLPLAVTLTSFLFMPDEVPVHFGINNHVDRWGSKYELLILPFVTIVIGIVFLLIARHLDKKEDNGSNNYNVMTTIGIAILGLFNILTYYILYIAFTQVQDLDSLKIDMLSLLTFTFGIVFIIIGNVVPKTKKNHFLGLRTKWSMSSEEAWKKSQRFGGYALIITGLITIVFSLVLNGSASVFAMIMTLIVMTIVDTAYSYFASKK
ncbi:MAG: SdpI family protein [Ruminococcus sp.]|nr:SdpI family protein [Ruminococcus sp.]